MCKTRVENWMGAVDSPKRLFSRAVKSARRIENIDRAPKKNNREKRLTVYSRKKREKK